MKILITGVAGFIGLHVAQRLLGQGHHVVGIDNLNDYYAVALKEARLKQLVDLPGFRFERMDLVDGHALTTLFAREGFTHIVHLAAQAGVRYSLQNPHAYINSNVTGFLNILEGARHASVEHLVYASSSSVYGTNTHIPWNEKDAVDHPASLYAATKKSNELMAHAYSHLFNIPSTGLRFFTVYGPWGRPDMAYFKFTRAILAGEPIAVFNQGYMQRDFTYVDDIVEGVVRVLIKPATAHPQFNRAAPDAASSDAPWRLYNIGNQQPVALNVLIETLERHLGRRAIQELMPMQAGDVEATFADGARLTEAVGALPHTSLETGIEQFVSWYRSYYA
jgi:UDP-glucuronate 4-epimerase